MDSLDAFASDKLEGLTRSKLRRSLVETERLEGGRVRRNGRSLVSFACNDYFGLSHHPAVKEAAMQAVRRYGAGAGASRLVSGDHPLLHRLETALAVAKGTGDALVFGSGYLASMGIVPALAGEGDLILIDALSHACAFSAARLSGAAVRPFAHNDVADLARLLAEQRSAYRHCLVLTETVFSMDGDRAPLAASSELARAHDAWLMTDDAHGLGFTDADAKAAGVKLQMGTLSKALGSYGGYLCASIPVIDLLRSRARPMVYSTALPPASAAAALAALELLLANPGWAETALGKAARFAAGLRLPAPSSPIVPVIVGQPQAALDLQRRLEEAGYLAVAIRPPTVPEGTARLRFTFNPSQADADIDAAAACVREFLRLEAA